LEVLTVHKTKMLCWQTARLQNKKPPSNRTEVLLMGITLVQHLGR
jgi:hypothetical protein